MRVCVYLFSIYLLKPMRLMFLVLFDLRRDQFYGCINIYVRVCNHYILHYCMRIHLAIIIINSIKFHYPIVLIVLLTLIRKFRINKSKNRCVKKNKNRLHLVKIIKKRKTRDHKNN